MKKLIFYALTLYSPSLLSMQTAPPINAEDKRTSSLDSIEIDLVPSTDPSPQDNTPEPSSSHTAGDTHEASASAPERGNPEIKRRAKLHRRQSQSAPLPTTGSYTINNDFNLGDSIGWREKLRERWNTFKSLF